MRWNQHSKPVKLPIRDRSNLLKRLSVLMKEGYLLPVALKLLLPMHTKRVMEADSGITSILKEGGTAADLFRFLGFKENVLFPIEIAEHHGRLAASIDGIAKNFDRTEGVKVKLRNLLVYPVSLLFFTSLLFLFFRTNYVPNLQDLMTSLQASEENASSVPEYLLNLPDMFIAIIAAAVAGAFIYWTAVRKLAPELQIRSLLATPFVSNYMRLYWSHLFAGELGTLLHSGISLQESLRLLQNQQYHGVIRFMAEEAQREIRMGEDLSEAVKRQSFFAADMSSFIQHGELTGFLGKELILYSEVLMERIERQTQQVLRIIQPLFFLIIAACIVGAYLAILLPMYNLVHTI